MNWLITDEAEADLIAGREWIAADNADAAQEFLQSAKDCFERLTQFPETGAAAKIKGREFSGLRFIVLSPPFNRWIVFYHGTSQIEVIRVLYGAQNWRNAPRRFF